MAKIIEKLNIILVILLLLCLVSSSIIRVYSLLRIDFSVIDIPKYLVHIRIAYETLLIFLIGILMYSLFRWKMHLSKIAFITLIIPIISNFSWSYFLEKTIRAILYSSWSSFISWSILQVITYFLLVSICSEGGKLSGEPLQLH